MSAEAARAVCKDMPTRDELLSLEALLVARVHLYALFHAAFGGQPDGRLIAAASSQETADALEEYAGESDTLAKLAAFLKRLGAKCEDEGFLEDACDEFARFFQGPAAPPASPWESVYVGDETMVFQANTLAVREAYATQGLRVRAFGHMPDDHVSIMCGFMEEMGRRTHATFRAGDAAVLAETLRCQREFVCGHMENWLPEYAKRSLRVNKAVLYPHLAQGVAAFVALDGAFLAEALAWTEGVSSACGGYFEAPCDSAAFFGRIGEATANVDALHLRGCEDNELAAID